MPEPHPPDPVDPLWGSRTVRRFLLLAVLAAAAGLVALAYAGYSVVKDLGNLGQGRP